VAFYIDLYIAINFKELNKAYDELEIDSNSKILKGHLHEHKGIYEFMERYWDKVILHLKEFNQDEDNYIEIAKLAHSYRGGIIGTGVYGI
jgi:hypothetical protein